MDYLSNLQKQIKFYPNVWKFVCYLKAQKKNALKQSDTLQKRSACKLLYMINIKKHHKIHLVYYTAESVYKLLYIYELLYMQL